MAADTGAMLAAAQATVDAAQRSGDRLALYVGNGYRAWAESRRGAHAAAADLMARCVEVGESLGARLVIADWFAAARAELALNAGRADEAIELAAGAVVLARAMGGIFGEALAHRVWAEALSASRPPRADEADEHFAAALRLMETGAALAPAAHLRQAWDHNRSRHRRAERARA
jgi:hypothetical protein